MKTTLFLATSLGLAGSLAIAAQEQATEGYDPNRDITTETQEPTPTMDERQQDTPVESDYGTAQTEDPTYGEQTYGEQEGTTSGTQQDQTRHQTQQQTQQQTYGSDQGQGSQEDLTSLSAEELVGKTIQTSDGEEIGTIDEVWTNATSSERVAVVEAGGFLGVGERTIAIPVSDLQKATSGEGYRTSQTRGSLESQPEFDDSGYTREESDMQDQDTTGQEDDTDY